MNLNIKNHSMNTLFVFSALSVFSNVGHAESSTVLDSSQHPVSPEHQTVFSTTMIPLDATLSWTERFNGNESFNDNQVFVENMLFPGIWLTFYGYDQFIGHGLNTPILNRRTEDFKV